MRSRFAGIGVIVLATTPLAAIPLALPSMPARAQVELATKTYTATGQAAHIVHAASVSRPTR
ncbi:hypothetical protein [Novosphingobium resinovorum]|uniref:Uncharacterized protein n=1 Tax=Novosphingobium resinovorum TaxID=158500 RepID=A0A031JIH5_9SPHN|nr:hypothetical protein [Novosphingobium resinovorum]AOR79786.1 hypothetical protein BES08_23745 [Novosphingobium resinovorum]EZP73047.1 hypothetical protein BV97_05058 [Novosphingobium resinovorum]